METTGSSRPQSNDGPAQTLRHGPNDVLQRNMSRKTRWAPLSASPWLRTSAALGAARDTGELEEWPGPPARQHHPWARRGRPGPAERTGRGLGEEAPKAGFSQAPGPAPSPAAAENHPLTRPCRGSGWRVGGDSRVTPKSPEKAQPRHTGRACSVRPRPHASSRDKQGLLRPRGRPLPSPPKSRGPTQLHAPPPRPPSPSPEAAQGPARGSTQRAEPWPLLDGPALPAASPGDHRGGTGPWGPEMGSVLAGGGHCQQTLGAWVRAGGRDRAAHGPSSCPHGRGGRPDEPTTQQTRVR